MATTTNYGWETPDDTDLVKDGALAIRTSLNAVDSTLGTALNNKLHAGLVLVKAQTIGTGVSSVTVTGAFSATYDDYQIIVSGGTGSSSTGADINVQLTGITGTSYYSSMLYSAFGGTTAYCASQTTTFVGWAGNTSSNGNNMNLFISSPFASRKKMASGNFIGSGPAFYNGTVRSYIDSTTSSSGFTLTFSSGTITGGTIAVYGYAKD